MTALFIRTAAGRYRKASPDEVQEAHTAYMSEQIRSATLGSPGDTKNFLLNAMQGWTHEKFAVLFLDARNRVIAFDIMFTGTIDGASVHPRVIVQRSLMHNAASVILAHNHPSGEAEPSRADRALTKRLQEALALVDVRILDHFVIGHGVFVSFAERGWM